MTTTFRHCFLVNFAVRPASLSRLLPTPLAPDIHAGFAFVSIVIAEMHRMRPAILPAPFGVTYDQVVYRAVVRCGDERGVTFLRSDANSRLMVLGGNLLTFFRFHHATTNWVRTPERVRFSLTPRSDRVAIAAEYDLSTSGTCLPASSRFRDLRSAEKFLTELYAAFGSQRRDGRVEVVRIARTPWNSAVVNGHAGTYEAMTSGTLFQAGEAEMDSIFYVRELEYQWRPLELAHRTG